jgi:cobalamin biosynthesis protein CobD/CbiB
MHYRHTIATRDAEQHLRRQQTENRTARAHSLRYGVIALACMLATGLAWFALPETGWLQKLLPLLCAVVALGYFHSLPMLDRDMERVTQDLNVVLRKRVESLNWRTLIHKLALLLGYKKIEGIEVFRQQHPETGGNPRRPH